MVYFSLNYECYVTLVSNLPVVLVIVGFLCPHIENQANGQKVEILDKNSDLRANQKEQRRGHFPITSLLLYHFFLYKTVCVQTVPFLFLLRYNILSYNTPPK